LITVLTDWPARCTGFAFARFILGPLTSEIWQLSASELADRIARRQLSSIEVVDAHLARIDAVNPSLNAVVRVLADEARASAISADKRLAAGGISGPLHGVPFTVKENIDMAGLPTTWGVPALAQAVVPTDAPVVERMRAAGAIPIGRTNLPDMALRPHTAATKELMRPMVPANLLGLPSACVPAGRDEGTGLPIGVLITGRRLREDLCLEAAEAIEARLGSATPIDPVG
jgi:Asp-tRNA(Asn)/Glu-tRNA(Gln) amidotransferase A subunit family amidase